jgi:predicted N-acetyltransferase YhbS
VEIGPFEARHESGTRMILSACGWSATQIEAQIDAIRALGPLDSGMAAVASDEGDRVGFVAAEFCGWNRLVQIHGLAVDPRLRRGGIGSRLVEVAEDFARARRARGLYADTPVDNDADARST